jgi:hypothetical protein
MRSRLQDDLEAAVLLVPEGLPGSATLSQRPCRAVPVLSILEPPRLADKKIGKDELFLPSGA